MKPIRIRFSTRTLLLGITFVAVVLGIGLLVHKHYVIPRTPLTWSTCTSERIRKFFDGDHPVLIYSYHSLSDVNLGYHLEHLTDNEPSTEFRKLVSREKVELIKIAFSYDSGKEIVELMRLLNKKFPERFKENEVPPQILLILPSSNRVFYPSFEDDDTEFIMEKIRNNK